MDRSETAAEGVEAELKAMLQPRRAAAVPDDGAGSTVAAVAENFLRLLDGTRKRPDMACYIVAKDILPVIGHLPLRALKKSDCRAVIAKVTGRGAKVHAGKVLGLLKQMLDYAENVEDDFINPAARLKAANLEIENNARDRWLGEEEIPLFWSALESSDPRTRAALRLLLLTGVRSQELRLARWAEIDLDARTWTIPIENQKLTLKQARQAKPFVIPIDSEARALFEELRALAGALPGTRQFRRSVAESHGVAEPEASKKMVKRVWLVGSGAVERSWEPIYAALRQVRDPVPDGTAEAAFATLVFQLRWSHAARARLQREEEAERSAGNKAAAEAAVKKVRALDAAHTRLHDEMQKLRDALVEQLRKAVSRGELSVRKEVDKAAYLFRPALPNRPCVATTNWDGVIEEFFARRGVTVVPIHGSIADPPGSHPGRLSGPESLYLPTEISEEPYRQPDGKHWHGELHLTVQLMAEEADELLVYGLSFSPLDPEVGMLITEAHAHREREKEKPWAIVVIDTQPNAVAARLQSLAPTSKITRFTPEELERLFLKSRIEEAHRLISDLQNRQ